VVCSGLRRYEGFRHYVTGCYKLNCVETMTGLKIVLTTDVEVGDIQQDLRDIYKVRARARVCVCVCVCE
jgi:hypothetical protein